MTLQPRARSLAVMRLAAILLSITAVAAPARAGEAHLYLIQNEAGETLGWQRETCSENGTVSERKLAYRVDGHGVQQQYLRVEAHRGEEPVVIMGTSQTDARRVQPESINDLSPLRAVIDASEGLANADFRVLGPDHGSIRLVEQRRGSQFVAAWLVERHWGQVVTIHQPRLEGDWIFRPIAEGTSALDNTPVANMAHPLVDAPYDIPGTARRGQLRYIFAAPFGVGQPLPETGEQKVRQMDGHQLQIDVCATCGPGLSTSAEDLARWTKPTLWLESDAPELRQTAQRARRGAKSDAQVMRDLSRIARKRLAGVDYDGHYSALAAWNRRRGDCTEDAVLLAALARAAGIPARVVTGLAYERQAYHGTANAFLPHTWTVVYVDGQWRSYDLSLGRFSAGHIAFAITDGEASAIQSGWQLAALIELEDMAEVRQAANPAR